jgi:RNA polymerase-binding transcription factor DksA
MSDEIPERWKWHHDQLLSLRERLLADVYVNEEEMRAPIEPHSMDIADSATDEIEHDLALGMLSHEVDALFEIDAALARIADGSYGICEQSGRPIPDERLRAVPWTRHTCEVQARLEQRGQVELPHLPAAVSIQGDAPGGLAQSGDAEQEELINRERKARETAGHVEELTGVEVNPLPLQLAE